MKLEEVCERDRPEAKVLFELMDEGRVDFRNSQLNQQFTGEPGNARFLTIKTSSCVLYDDNDGGPLHLYKAHVNRIIFLDDLKDADSIDAMIQRLNIKTPFSEYRRIFISRLFVEGVDFNLSRAEDAKRLLSWSPRKEWYFSSERIILTYRVEDRGLFENYPTDEATFVSNWSRTVTHTLTQELSNIGDSIRESLETVVKAESRRGRIQQLLASNVKESKAGITRTIEEINEDEDVESCEFNANSMCVITKRLTARVAGREVFLGKFKIAISVSGEVTVQNLMMHPTNTDYLHPHVSSFGACLGGFDTLILQAISALDYAQVVHLIIAYLHGVTEDDSTAMNRLSHFKAYNPKTKYGESARVVPIGSSIQDTLIGNRNDDYTHSGSEPHDESYYVPVPPKSRRKRKAG